MSAAEIWAKLLAGNARMREDQLDHPHADLTHRASLVERQQPLAAVLSCADSRVPVEFVFDQGFGDLFVVRNAGPVIAPITIGSLEYAILALGVELVVVLTHQGCGAIAAAQDRQAAHPGSIQDLVGHISPRVKNADAATGPTLHAADLVTDFLSSSPLARGRMEAGALGVVGAVYDLTHFTVTEVVPFNPTSA